MNDVESVLKKHPRAGRDALIRSSRSSGEPGYLSRNP
jgi:hypothetical protein